MKKLLIILPIAVLLLAGCSTQSEKNDRIISETKKCLDAGMEAQALSTLEGVIGSIQCSPSKGDR